MPQDDRHEDHGLPPSSRLEDLFGKSATEGLDTLDSIPTPDALADAVPGGVKEAAPAPEPVPEGIAPSRPNRGTKAKADRPLKGARMSTAKGKSKKGKGRRGGTVLGVYVSPTTVYGILIGENAGRYGVLRRFARQRSEQSGDTPELDLSNSPIPELDAGDADVSFEVGDGAGGDIFLASEFSGLDVSDQEFTPPEHQKATPVVFEIKDILDECAAAGYENPPVAFCVSTPDVEYVEIALPDGKKEADVEGDEEENAKKGGETVKRERLFSVLREEHPEAFDKDRVAFVPMTPREGQRRWLAVVPTAGEPLAESLELLREQAGSRRVPLRMADSEVSLLVGLVRYAFPTAPEESTAVVRVGTEDTLVLLLQGGELHHQEHMRSVTTFDGADIICSRVLLQQDVQGIGTVHQVVVLSEEREDELVQGFSAFYPAARVVSLRSGLVERGVAPPAGGGALSARSLPALGVALRLQLDRDKDSPFEPVNLLPKRLRRKKRSLDRYIAWHTLIAGVVLFLTVLFFVSLYFGQQREIAEAEERVAAYPEQLSLSGPALQAQIDSLQSVYTRITRTLDTVDSLLVGSDRWTRSLEKTARAATATGGVWVSTWNPDQNRVRLNGYATSRDRVVQYAERLNGSIESLSFQEIREYPVYDFTLVAPVPTELPEVALYLREQADVSGSLGAPEPEPLDGFLEEGARPAED